MTSTASRSAQSKVVYVLLAMLLLLSGLAYLLGEQNRMKKISNYEQCAAAKGSVMLLTYPAICTTKDGKSFTQNVPGTDAPKVDSYESCVRAGGSNDFAIMPKECRINGLIYTEGQPGAEEDFPRTR
jgi:hypothetical protein